MPSDVHFPPVFKPLVDPVVQIKLAQLPVTGLSVGQTVEARVLERLEDGRFIIRIGSSHLTAEAEPTLKPGQAMTLRVDSLSPRVLLSVVPPPEERITAEHTCGFSGPTPARSRRVSPSLPRSSVACGVQTSPASPAVTTWRFSSMRFHRPC